MAKRSPPPEPWQLGPINVAAVRKSTRRPGAGWPPTQAAFAHRFGFSAAAVRDWEQGRRQPCQAVRVLLAVIAQAPDTVEAAIQRARQGAELVTHHSTSSAD